MPSHLKLMLTSEVHQLEYDPEAQYKFNFWAMWFWFWQMPILAVLLFSFNRFWVEISVFYVAEASVWALVATHLGAMSAALAAKHEDGQVQIIKKHVKGVRNVKGN